MLHVRRFAGHEQISVLGLTGTGALAADPGRWPRPACIPDRPRALVPQARQDRSSPTGVKILDHGSWIMTPGTVVREREQAGILRKDAKPCVPPAPLQVRGASPSSWDQRRLPKSTAHQISAGINRACDGS